MKILGVGQRAADVRRALARLRREVDYVIQTGDGKILGTELPEVAGELAGILGAIDVAVRDLDDPVLEAAYQRFLIEVRAFETLHRPARSEQP